MSAYAPSLRKECAGLVAGQGVLTADIQRGPEAGFGSGLVYYLTSVQPAFEALIYDIPMLARANAQKRIQDAEQKQRKLATQLSEKEAMRLSIFESYAKENLTQRVPSLTPLKPHSDKSNRGPLGRCKAGFWRHLKMGS